VDGRALLAAEPPPPPTPPTPFSLVIVLFDKISQSAEQGSRRLMDTMKDM
jgi:hypothetical protein